MSQKIYITNSGSIGIIEMPEKPLTRTEEAFTFYEESLAKAKEGVVLFKNREEVLKMLNWHEPLLRDVIHTIPVCYSVEIEEIPFLKASFETDEMFKDRVNNSAPIKKAILKKLPPENSANKEERKIKIISIELLEDSFEYNRMIDYIREAKYSTRFSIKTK